MFFSTNATAASGGGEEMTKVSIWSAITWHRWAMSSRSFRMREPERGGGLYRCSALTLVLCGYSRLNGGLHRCSTLTLVLRDAYLGCSCWLRGAHLMCSCCGWLTLALVCSCRIKAIVRGRWLTGSLSRVPWRTFWLVYMVVWYW